LALKFNLPLKLSRVLLAVFFVAAGVNHFVSPENYLQIIPPFLPARAAANYVSGLAEILGGVGILFVPTRRLAALGLILLLILVFPANIYGALHGMQISDWDVPRWVLWLRLPIQPLLIAWVYFAGWKADKPPR
jgi:uncharacterized membrane protein